MYAKMEVVAEPVVPAVQWTEAVEEEEADSEEDDSGEPSILQVLNED
jgi:hypothetical protein